MLKSSMVLKHWKYIHVNYGMEKNRLNTSNNLRMKLYISWIQNWSDKPRTHFIVSFEKI